MILPEMPDCYTNYDVFERFDANNVSMDVFDDGNHWLNELDTSFNDHSLEWFDSEIDTFSIPCETIIEEVIEGDVYNLF